MVGRGVPLTLAISLVLLVLSDHFHLFPPLFPVQCCSISIPIPLKNALLSCSQTASRAATGPTDQSPAPNYTTRSAHRVRRLVGGGTTSSCPLAPQKLTLTAIVSVRLERKAI